MGTEVHCKSSFEGYYSMGDVNQDSNSSSWPLFYGDKSLTNGHYYNSYIPKTVADATPGCDKDGLKQKMLEHEAVFKNQVFELHRLYRRQRDMMEEVKMNEYHKHCILIDTSPSYEDGHKWQMSKWNNNNITNNNSSLKDCEIMENRPSKVRKRLFDLELPPDDNVYHEHASEELSYRGPGVLADLNVPVNAEERMGHESVNGLGPLSKPNGPLFLDPPCDTGVTSKVSDNYRFTPFPFPTSCIPSTDSGNFRGKSNGGLIQKLTSFHKQPSFLSSPPSHAVFGDKWRVNGCYTPNGFFHGSSSMSKDPYTRLPSGGFDYRNYNNLDDRSQKIFKGSNFIDLTDTTKGVDLNNDNNSSRKCDQTVLPWLQERPNISKNEKILWFSVFGNSCVSKNESSSLRCPCENGKIKGETENRGFDINVAWDDHENKNIDVEDFDIGNKPDMEIDKVKNNFDLNSCLTEEEDVLVPEKVKKITMVIDLEAPTLPEEEETIDDEFLVKVAAEAIVAMTGLTEISGQQDQAGSTSEVALHSNDNDHLLWFVEVVENASFVFNERDEYEELTLKQELTKEEDYIPKPLALDFQEPDEPGPSSGLGRPRRGQARRGRPRRDFQRDILPGLVSLSRHEVTEDLQIFGGLMRATGHSWNAGLTRWNGTKGKRKSVVTAVEPPPPSATPPPPLLEVVGLEDGSLTGWGKTPRRPRRQRCAAGTSVVVPLT
ncbi:uncharacterized protein LOC143612564 [Bidens hawaiensis]|uniref:uncharacterized protein LOC143612564 n=1 Tax=Bidens hawaiensis TaxID=980011 RepID=UPI00404B4040